MKTIKPFALYQPERPVKEKENSMTKVKFTLNPKKPPKTPKADLVRFDALRDKDIDYSDIPELDESFWKNATVKPPQIKPNVSLRIPEDVIEYFKAENPKGFTGRMAAVLTAYVQAHQSK